MINLFESRVRAEPAAGATEIVALRSALAAERRVAAELAHRNRNLVGVVAALGRRVLAEAADLPAARAGFESLVADLAAGEDAGEAAASRRRPGSGEARLTSVPSGPNRSEAGTRRGPGGPLPTSSIRDLRALAAPGRGGLAAGAAGRRRLAGPRVGLAPPAARLLALVLFELATNAVKHGALRRPGGRVRLDWTRGADGDLYLRWRETPAPGEAALSAGGPAGGGSALFDGLAADLGGRFRRIPFAAGFAAEIVLPACHLVETPRNAAAPEGPSTAQSPTPAVEAAPEDPRPARPRRVLVVEDNALIADDLTDMLRREGVGEVVVALSAQEARAALEGEGFDLVLLDVALGDGSAESLLPQLGAARVLLVSGRSVEDMPAALRGLPLLPKPFLPADLARVLG